MGDQSILLRIVSRICEYSQIESPLDTVTAHYDNSMFVSFQKLFVKQNPPLSVKKFPVTVSKKYVFREFVTEMFC